MRKKLLNRKWFTLVELLVVITIIGILGTIWYVSYTKYQSDSIFSKDNSWKVTALANEMQVLFSKDHTINDGTNQLEFKVIENTITPTTLTYSQMANIYKSSITSVPASAISNVLVCWKNASAINIDNGLTQSSFNNAYLNLIIFVDQATATTDCVWTNVLWAWTKVIWTVVRYKNNQINESEDYITYISADWGNRSSMTDSWADTVTAGNFQFYWIANVIDRTLNNTPTTAMKDAY